MTRNGREYVVIMAAEDLESLEATIELLSDPAAQARIADSEAEVARGVTSGRSGAASLDGGAAPQWQLTAVRRRHDGRCAPVPGASDSAAAFAAHGVQSGGPLAQNPHRVGATLRAPFEGLYRARRGEYWVFYRSTRGHHRDCDRRRPPPDVPPLARLHETARRSAATRHGRVRADRAES